MWNLQNKTSEYGGTKERQTKILTLNHREQTDSYQRDMGGGIGLYRRWELNKEYTL